LSIYENQGSNVWGLKEEIPLTPYPSFFPEEYSKIIVAEVSQVQEWRGILNTSQITKMDNVKSFLVAKLAEKDLPILIPYYDLKVLFSYPENIIPNVLHILKEYDDDDAHYTFQVVHLKNKENVTDEEEEEKDYLSKPSNPGYKIDAVMTTNIRASVKYAKRIKNEEEEEEHKKMKGDEQGIVKLAYDLNGLVIEEEGDE
jgi:hypothetical protein